RGGRRAFGAGARRDDLAPLGLAPVGRPRVAAVARLAAVADPQVAAQGFLGRRRVQPAAEDHLARRRLEHAGDADLDRLAQGLLGLVHDHHRAVVEVADSLAGLLALLDDDDAHALAGQ